jgi:hypothetical protein
MRSGLFARAANEAVTFLIQRAPLPELVEPSQDGQFFLVG